MVYTNSPLVTYTNITNNKTPNRKHSIDTITIHCLVAQWTAKEGCDYFATTDQKCSANYVVGKDGSIGLSVDEKDRSWCSSSSANDNRAVTIEVASDKTEPYAVTDAAYNALIQLVADICKRNGIKELKWKGDKNLVGQVDKQNMTVHRWFKNKACPGEYLYERHSDIAAKVNTILNKSTNTPTDKQDISSTMYRVQVGAFSSKENANAMLKKVKTSGFDGFIIQVNGIYKLQVGAYSKKKNADMMLEKLKKAGYDGFITTDNTPVKRKIQVGSTVRVKKGAKSYTGGNLASFVYERDHKVKQINVDRVVITYQGIVVTAIKKCDLDVVE